ncbi:MAG: hypothetical protein HY060_02340 [Proteobacteria bacterium]|nr:hypothetical protein [Pseudomonadota bacterium]
MQGEMAEKSGDKSKLAQELLDSLRSDISARAKTKPSGTKDEPSGPRRIVTPTEGMATGHQKRDNKRFGDVARLVRLDQRPADDADAQAPVAEARRPETRRPEASARLVSGLLIFWLPITRSAI